MCCYDDTFVVSCRSSRRSKQSSESICCFGFGAINIKVNVNTGAKGSRPGRTGVAVVLRGATSGRSGGSSYSPGVIHSQ